MRLSKLFASVRLLDRGLNYGTVITRTCSSVISPEVGSAGTDKKGLVVCVYEKNKKLELTPVAEEVDQKCGGKISQHLNVLCSELKLGKAFVVTDILDYSAVSIACIGPKDAGYNQLESLDESRENIRWGVGAGVRLLVERGAGVTYVDPCTAPDAAAEAAELAAWKFQVFKSPEDCKPPCGVSVYGSGSTELALWCEGSIRGQAQNWARCLSDMPANKMTPVDLAQAALDRLCSLGIEVEAHDREWIEAQRMRAFLAVAKGSCDTPIFLECSYKGGSTSLPPVLLVAKGVTFDSGGMCLKECHSMTENRGSMAGAAVVLAALEVIAKMKVPINVAAVIPICENMVSGQCMKVGDVVQALNGMSIQIENTDMEGRLMMADALVYGQTVYKPSLVIDVATFTRGVLMATGGCAFGCFSNSEAAWRALRCAGAAAGDRAWRFPLWRCFQSRITNDPSVDLRNRGSGYATPCIGAAFLKNFVCCDWLHMDITGVGKIAHSGAPPYLDTRRMTGRPTRTLAILIQQIAISTTTQQPCVPPPQPCVPPPQPCVPPPQPCVPRPQPFVPPPQPCVPPPQPCVPRPQPGVSPPQPCVPRPQSCVPRPQPCVPRPQPCVPRPQPCVPRPQPCVPRPQPCVPRPQPCVPRPQPCVPPPQPCVPPPQPCVPPPQPFVPPPQPFVPPPQPCVPPPQPCVPPPQPCVPRPQPCVPPRRPTVIPRQPCVPPPQPCVPPPQSCVPLPQPCVPPPQPCATPPQGGAATAKIRTPVSDICAPKPIQSGLQS